MLCQKEIFENAKSYEPSKSTQMSSVQKLRVPVLFFYKIAVYMVY